MTEPADLPSPPDQQPSTAEAGEPWHILFDLWLLEQAVYPLVEGSIEELGISADEWGLYLMIDEFQPITPGDIARYSGMRPNTVSAALQRLERRGDITRVPNERDGRSVLISLSQKGQKVSTWGIEANRYLGQRLDEMVDVELVRDGLSQLNRAVRRLANLPARFPPSNRPRPEAPEP